MKRTPKSFFTAFLVCILITAPAYAESVIPLGKAVGVCIRTDGLLITGTSEVTDENGHSVNAAKLADLRKGDRILAVDGNNINTNEKLGEYISNRSQKIVFSVVRDGKPLNKIASPVKTADGYKIGLWVRDSTAGIGTLTYYNPEDNSFGGLGHGISDIDTGDILTVKKGNILTCQISEPVKGKKGTPGELNGTFTAEKLGVITKNTASGIYGKITDGCFEGTAAETASADEVTTGDAYILSDTDGTGTKKYTVNIQKILGKKGTKNMVISITDKTLVEKTGGIVQGMSGSPIIQNGKLVGAVTHVFVNDPTRGYGIFIENMLSEAEK